MDRVDVDESHPEVRIFMEMDEEAMVDTIEYTCTARQVDATFAAYSHGAGERIQALLTGRVGRLDIAGKLSRLELESARRLQAGMKGSGDHRA